MKRLVTWFKSNNVLESFYVNFKTGEYKSEPARFRLVPFFEPGDLWVGLFVDREKRIVYFCPVPMCGIKFFWG